MGRSFTFWCAACHLDLDDGVDYTTCPRCRGPIEWVAQSPRVHNEVPTPSQMSAAALGILVVTQAILAVLDPHGFTYLRPLLVILWICALPGTILAIAFVPALSALLDERTRVIHGLEHATIAVLAERGVAVSRGVTLPGMFDLTLPNNGRSWDLAPMIRAAATDAIRRVSSGERSLVYTDRCGTSYVVGILLTCLAVAGAGAVAFVYGIPHGYAFAGTVGMLVLARLASRILGLLAQRLLTVSARATTATVGSVEAAVSPDGNHIYYVVHISVAPAPFGTAIGEPV